MDVLAGSTCTVLTTAMKSSLSIFYHTLQQQKYEQLYHKQCPAASRNLQCNDTGENLLKLKFVSKMLPAVCQQAGSVEKRRIPCLVCSAQSEHHALFRSPPPLLHPSCPPVAQTERRPLSEPQRVTIRTEPHERWKYPRCAQRKSKPVRSGERDGQP